VCQFLVQKVKGQGQGYGCTARRMAAKFVNTGLISLLVTHCTHTLVPRQVLREQTSALPYGMCAS